MSYRCGLTKLGPLGGFQLNIQVEKATDLWEAERRTLELFHKRLSLKADNDRWSPIVTQQVEFTRARARGRVELANDENPDQDPIIWTDPMEVQKGKKVRVVLEKIQINDDREPFFKEKGNSAFSLKSGHLTMARSYPKEFSLIPAISN